MSSAEFETEIPAFERPQAYALDRTATGIASTSSSFILKFFPP